MACLVCIPAPALADDAALGRAGSNVMPVYNNQIRMAHEIVTVDLQHNTVDAVFTFQNLGPETTTLIGFPMLKESPYSPDRGEGKLEPYFGYQSFRAFEVLADGTQMEILTEVKPGLPPPAGVTPPGGEYFSKWVVFQVFFRAGETKKIRNTYNAEYAYRNSIGENRLEYVLTTGSTWHGTIGEAEIVVNYAGVDPWKIRQVSPAGYQVKDGAIRWSLKDFEPSGSEDNISVVFAEGWQAILRSDDGLDAWNSDQRFAELAGAVRAGETATVISLCDALLAQVGPALGNVKITEGSSRLYDQRATLLALGARHRAKAGQHREAVASARQLLRESMEWPSGSRDWPFALQLWIDSAKAGGLDDSLFEAVRESQRYGLANSFFRQWALGQIPERQRAAALGRPSGLAALWQRILAFFREPDVDLVSLYRLEDAEVLYIREGQDHTRAAWKQHDIDLVRALGGLARSRTAGSPPDGERLYRVILGPSLELEMKGVFVRPVLWPGRGDPGGKDPTPSAWYRPGKEFLDVVTPLRSSLERSSRP
jgi:hypothetical protein